jgi:putative transposase
LLNRGHGRSQVFHDAADYDYFVSLLRRSLERVPMRLIAFCLMPNHFHLVTWPASPGDTAVWMHWLMTAHVARHRRRYETLGAIWHGRYKSFPIQRDHHLITVLRYVERNPLRANLVRRAQDWRWSSLDPRQAPGSEGMLHPGPTPRPAGWATWIDTPQTAAEVKALRESVKRGRPFGDETWTQRAATELGIGNSIRPPGRPRRQRSA